MSHYDEEDTLILASLLHDIGKIRVRHDDRKKHAEHGSDMLRDILGSSVDIKFMNSVSKLIRFHHHRPEDTDLEERDIELLKILKDADCKSAAHERVDRDHPKQQSGPYLEKFTSYISLDKENKKRKEYPKFKVYPEREIINNGDKDSGYALLDGEIINEISNVSSDNFKNYVNSINSILRNTTSYVPSAFFYSNANIPLYDHLKITAAIALCRYRSKKENNSDFILIRTDLSGIQDYIFRYFRSEQADDKGTKRIRGRSLRVSLTTRAIVEYIVDELNLYDVNVVWLNSDGSLIMAPYTEENEKKLTKIRETVGKYLIQHDRGISCAIEWNRASYEIIPQVKEEEIRAEEDLQIEDSGFKSFIAELMNRINKVKRQNNKEIMAKEKEGYFIEKEMLPCWSCGLNDREENEKCKECLIEEDIGSKIVKDEETIILDKEKEGNITFTFGSSTYSFRFDNPNPESKNYRILYINNYPKKIKDFGVSWELITIGNFVPEIKGKIQSINDMLKVSENPEENREYFYLGIFKADVDNMGKLISNGFPRFTIPAYAAFSRQISTFFTAGINKIADDHGVYLIYSGGDDVSALGPIDKIVEFASELHNKFCKWMSNDFITLSAGIATTHAKFPLRRGIDIAEHQLALSKGNSVDHKPKDSVTVFETTMTWEEFERMSAFKEKMQGKMLNVANDDVKKSFMQKLLKMDELNPYRDDTRGSKTIKGKDLTFPDHLIYYDLERNWKGSEIDKGEFISELVRRDTFKFIRYPATYILIEKRRGRE
jgi:CRISPR-associated protein Csm1